MNTTLTSVPGLTVGHATAAAESGEGGASGCTVVLGPFRAAVEVRGLATGSRELGVLAPEHLVPGIDALVMAGGSAFGLAAADGVMSWLAERGRGYETGVAPVPIVPAAVIFDLAEGRPRPDADTGRAACDDASGEPVAEGAVGAGSGATVGKHRGVEHASAGGVGSWAVDVGEARVGALAVVNALGDVLDAHGRVVAGAPDGAEGGPGFGPPSGEEGGAGDGPRPGTHTTLAVVATDAPLARVDLARLARTASNALARRIHPVHTPFDGDVVFAVSTAAAARDVGGGELLALGTGAQAALEEAITRAVTVGREG